MVAGYNQRNQAGEGDDGILTGLEDCGNGLERNGVGGFKRLPDRLGPDQ